MPNAKSKVGSRAKKQHSLFMKRSLAAYNNLKARLKKRGLPLPAFTLDELREKIRAALDKPCKYSPQDRDDPHYHEVTLRNFSPDHNTPIERGGSTRLSGNIDIVCHDCNLRKDVLMELEFHTFLHSVWRLGVTRDDKIMIRKSLLGRLKAGSAIWKRFGKAAA